MSLRLPPLLEPYLALPAESSLVLATSVLGASTNWLVLRHLYRYLGPRSLPGEGADGVEGGAEEEVGVVLVSFMRDGVFWREGAVKLGLDLESLSKKGRFHHVDGLTGLFTEDDATSGRSNNILKSSRVDHVKGHLEEAVSHIRCRKTVLIIDQVDVLLAAAEETTSTSLSAMILSLRERVYSTLLTMSADAPLIQSQTTMLEREHAALVLGQAHEATRVFSLRMLDTGTARDVSGVVRITTTDEDEAEYLYFVAGDGNVKVFQRGT
ncbi:elongator complex protein 6 [Geosmithia morbida]|uniref:Elongator complex protein 6 n=1 Tax=Geosmithia morbida TaxID=1094350 RepID=A0A9P4YY28_9HYPO|nr:elongator complex protein 6 [Geosmithia morbida]KAF4124602.1 elongator complex protein 6 [Geosmithia morbida]